MASGTSRSIPQPPPPPISNPGSARRQPGWTGGAASGDAFIERQIRRTRRQVKLVDLATALMMLVAGVLAYLLAITLIDHWVIGLNFWARAVALVILIGGSLYYVAVVIWPLLVRPINPLYAARSIEQGAPTLKNSLINFLLFRSHRADVHEAVYRTLEQKAASDLSSIPMEHTVDRSGLIKIGYVLAAVLAACALYTIVSPKDVFQSVARVATPWREIARPSRVEISNVVPGDTEVYQGRSVAISAEVVGASSDADAVRLVYSSLDGQASEREIAMRLSESGLTYEATLPEDDRGVQHDLIYRIEAGDATSPTYRVQVSPAPVILVERVDYAFPTYTGRPPETVEREGDIRALEGTRVTIRARANQPIRSAFIEFDPLSATTDDAAGDTPATGARPQRRTLVVDGQTASVELVLELQADRRTPRHASYQLGFVTPDGHASEQPIVHQIQVVPDLPPEIAILTPDRERIEVREDQQQRIEVRGLDPDFGLSKIELKGVAGDAVVFEPTLFDEPSGKSGQTVVEYLFAPARLGLTAGTKVVYWATATDNRGVNGRGQPNPNVERTRNYTIEITPAPTTEPPAGEPPASESSEDAGGSEGGEGEKPGREEGGEKGEGSSSDDAGGSPDESGGSDAAEGAGGTQQGESGESREGEQGQEGSSGQPQPGSTAPGQASESSEAGGGSPQEDGQAGNSGGAGNRDQGTEREAPHDGEVFEKALERMREQQGGGRQSPRDAGANPPSGSGDSNGDPARGDEPGNEPSDDNASPQNGDASAESQQRRAEGQQPGRQPSPGSTPFGDQSQSPEGAPQGESQEQGDQPESPRSDNAQGAGAQREGTPGEGGQSSPKNGAEPNTGEKPQPAGPRDERMKEPGMGDNGDSGKGQNSQDTSGTGSVEQAGQQTSPNRDRKKPGQPDSSQPEEEADPGTTDSKRQSDSQGDQSGDKSGGGKKGPGQGANQAGNDSAGQNNASDDGAGAATEAGDGETANAPGQQQTADGQTGSAGSEKGDGSTSQRDPSGQRGSSGTPRPQGDPASQPESDSAAGGGGESGGQSGLPLGGGTPAETRDSSYSGPMDVRDGEKANLKYAQQVTDMVLDYLKDQQDNPDDELMRDLGWSKDDLQAFLERWESLRRGARDSGAEGERELEESLRSLGLRREPDRVRQGAATSDAQRGLSESGVESQPPAQYRDLFKAFRKGASRAKPQR